MSNEKRRNSWLIRAEIDENSASVRLRANERRRGISSRVKSATRLSAGWKQRFLLLSAILRAEWARECNLESITRSGVSSFLRVERWSNVQLEIFISPSPASPLSLLINDVPASRFGEASPKGCVPRWGNMTAARRTYEGIIKANQDQTLTRKRSRTLDEYVLQCALPSASLRTTTIISHLCRSIPISSAISRPWLRAGRHVTLVLAHCRRKSFGGRPGGIFVWQWLSDSRFQAILNFFWFSQTL